jgi:hypothetical protein
MKRTFSSLLLKRRATWLCVLLALFFFSTIPVNHSVAQIHKHPATISPVLGQPYGIYLSDYTTPGSNTLMANIVFNDFNEPVWNFRLRIKIESSAIRLETTPGFRPSSPITVTPGVMKTLSGADWEEYFNYNNLAIAGSSVNSLINAGGKLPEGFYSFCFQVLDYDTGDPLSQEVCQTAWIKLMEAPRVNLPSCGNSLDPKITQHGFTWQLFDTRSPNATEPPQYQLTVWELTERTANIQNAVANGQALQIFQSQFLSQPSYAYSLSDPPFEPGKQYIYRVQVVDGGGKDRYKNNGYSEFCTFYYGWPIGGKVNLKFPAENGGFRKKDIPIFNWSAVDTQLPTQAVSYEIKIAPWLPGQTKEQALNTNTPWYYYNTPAANIKYDRSQQVDKELKVTTKYAWQVKAFTDQQEVGKSSVGTFNGPALMENFWAGIHRVAVDYLDGSDINDISGGGRIRFEPNAEAWTAVRFEHLKLKDQGDFYIMEAGEFYYEPQNLTLTLNPVVADNDKAYFDVKRFRVNKDGIFVEGAVRWALPFPALTNGVPTVRSNQLFANYNDFAVNAVVALAPGNQFRLLEPFNFALDLHQTGKIYINNNNYRFDFNGTIELPERVKGKQPAIVKYPFINVDQLFYLEQDSLPNPSIMPLNKSNMELVTTRYILDLSEKKSPDKFSSQPAWKGIYLENFDLKFNKSLDGNGQLDMVEPFVGPIEQRGTSTDAWITSDGLDLKFDLTFPDAVGMVFQTFPAYVYRCKLAVENSQIVADQSLLKGGFLIPIISTERKFAFTVPINNIGFQDGYLEDLVNTKFTHNPGSGDNEIHLTVKRAVLSGYEKIGMTVDLEWPSLGVTLADLRGFNAWGDYTVGFDNKNGTVPLTQRYNASLSGYPITIGVIGAGSNNGAYVIATTADAGLGDDVSGGEGVPSINVYSVSQNKYVPLEAGGSVVEDPTQQISFSDASKNVEQEYDKLQENLAQQLEADQEAIVQQAEDLKSSMASGATYYTVEEIVKTDSASFPAETGEGLAPEEDGKFNSRQQEVIYEIAAGFVEEMARPLLDPIKHKTDSLSLAIRAKVGQFVAGVNVTIGTNVDKIVNGIAEDIASQVDNSEVDVGGAIREMGRRTSETIKLEIKTALEMTLEENVLQPIDVLLQEQIQGRVNKHVTVNGTNFVYAAISGERDDAEEALETLIKGTPKVLDSIIRDVIAFVSVDNIRSTVEATASGLVQNISPSDIGHDLRKAAEDVLKDLINQEAQEALTNLAEHYAEDLGLGGFDVGGENPINFVGAAERLAKGDIKGIFAIDPVRVKLRTPVIDLDGFMSYTPQHPVYGDVWLGDIDMTIKVPKKFAFNAIYFNGRKDDISYWFCQITPPGGNDKPYELGKPLPKAAKALEKPVDIGIAKIVGAAGRLYHHMKEAPNNGIVPDASMRYGAYMHFVFYDKGQNGKNLRLEVSGEINSSENGDYTIAFDGNLQIRSNSVNVLEIDKTAIVQGTVMIRYNSAEEHFLGYAKVVVNKPGSLCAQASLLVDVKPGKWRVAIGTREERVIFVPACAGWSPTGWLDLNQNVAELGLGLQYSARAKSPNVNLGFVKFNVQFDAGFAFGIVAAVQYAPSFALLKAGVWVDIWASIIANYKFPLRDWKSKTLVEIYIRGDLFIIFNPPPTTAEGKLNGTCKVVGFKIKFKASFKKEI